MVIFIVFCGFCGCASTLSGIPSLSESSVVMYFLIVTDKPSDHGESSLLESIAFAFTIYVPVLLHVCEIVIGVPEFTKYVVCVVWSPQSIKYFMLSLSGSVAVIV
jgi:hypothetical protein